MMTEQNYESIVDEALQACHKGSLNRQDSGATGTTQSTLDRDYAMQEHYAYRAVENYRRRIYDAWSVLNAVKVIEKTNQGQKQFKYNRQVLDDRASDNLGDEQQYTVTASQLK